MNPQVTPTPVTHGSQVATEGFVLPPWTWLDFLLFLAAIPAGVGGCLIGVRGADAINRRLGRAAPDDDQQEPRGKVD
jgi:hypothetical protein